MWWQGSFARILYPKAKLDPEHIAYLLERIGSVFSVRSFFMYWLDSLSGSQKRRIPVVIVERTGLLKNGPGELSLIRTDRDEICNQVRIVYAVREDSRLPVLLRVEPDNSYAKSLVTEAISELESCGMKPEYVHLDDRSLTDSVLSELLLGEVPFVTLCPKELNAWETAVTAVGDPSDTGSVAVNEDGGLFRHRIDFVAKADINHKGLSLHAYVRRDSVRQDHERLQILDTHKGKRSDAKKVTEELRRAGLEVWLSSVDLDPKDLIHRCTATEEVDQLFGLCRDWESLAPVEYESENAARGRLLLRFIGEVIRNRVEAEVKTIETDLTFRGILFKARNQKAELCGSVCTPCEPSKELKAIYRRLKVKPKSEYPLPPKRTRS
ncbi:hypothetical protein [Sutterella sp.]|uniref:hypothetical protein n=1 Tax=Sutterella sp. TaxID=1981025 RepID=UPI0026DF5372|nr:hypothetical protein [Sutterella sp.]MDO5532216.1 hypothetical protein [Sutterella sp.]